MSNNTLPTRLKTLTDELIALLVYEHRTQTRPALERLWEYYRNALDFDSDHPARPYRTAQEQGLPHRLVGASGDGGTGDKEIVVENDIAWRIHTLVDFMFGKGVTIQSLAEDEEKARVIERVLNACLDANGGVSFLQDMALLGGVYGHVDLLLRTDLLPPVQPCTSTGLTSRDHSAAQAPSKPFDARRAISYAKKIVLETVEAPRAIPVLNRHDYRHLDAYILHYTQQLNQVERGTFLARLVNRDGMTAGRLATVDVTEVWTTEAVRVYHDNELVSETMNVLGQLPVVHIQNLAQPFFYEGLSEVEPLIPLQDELNTRLSDRANRVTFQSFKMYLGKGIENFAERPVGPGQMWTTENLDAEILSFGGDGPNPSEDEHIREIREAMDKASAVTGVAAGLLRNKVGSLRSENALRIVMMGLLNRTEKKRVTYGAGLARVFEMILHALDIAGVLPTTEQERQVKLHWPSPLPEDQTQRLKEAKMKLEIGVPQKQVLAELGYVEQCQDAG